MEMLKNFSETFLSVWNKGILGVDIFQILIGIGIFLIFLIFRGLISKLIIKKLEVISKRTTNKLDDTFVSSLVGPARFIPIVLGFFIASYYMSFSSDGREVVDTINRTLITILIFWIIHQIIEPVSYILSGLDKLLTRELIGWIIKSLKIFFSNSLRGDSSGQFFSEQAQSAKGKVKKMTVVAKYLSFIFNLEIEN